MILRGKRTKAAVYDDGRSVQRLVKALAVVCVLILLRVWITEKRTYVFLFWNLFLAIIPLAAAMFTAYYAKTGWRLLAGSLGWLAFFPNAPYLITDIYHLSHLKGMPLWYDALLLFLSAATGLGAGFLSLRIMERTWWQAWQNRQRQVNKFKQWKRPVLLTAVFLLTGFGVYAGRVLRWNSWHVLSKPQMIVADVTERLLNPIDNIQTWSFTVIYGLVLYVIYGMINDTH